ncbi:MAG: PAS domain S-box protein, partial [Flavobacterium sp.]
ILSVTGQVAANQISFSEAEKKIVMAQDNIAKNWKAYKLTYITPEEKQVASEAEKLLHQSAKSINTVTAALHNKDTVALHKLIKKDLVSSVNPAMEKSKFLHDLQVEIGKNVYERSFKVYSASVEKILLLLFLAIPFSYYTIRKNRFVISKFQLSEKKLYQSEQNIRSMIELSGDAILILNEATEIINLNESACDLFGYARKELLQMSISDLIPLEEIEKQKAAIENVKKNKNVIVDRIIKRKDGTLKYIETNVRLIEGVGFFSVIRDVSERKKAELLLKESEEKYRYLFDNNPAYIIIWDLETLQILKVNKTTFETYGYTEEEWDAMTLLDIRGVEDHPKIIEFADYMLKNDEPIVRRNWRHVKKNGDTILMDIASHKITYENRPAILAIARDVTEQVLASQKLKTSEEIKKLIMDSALDAIVGMDTKGLITIWTPQAENIFGWSEDEVIGKRMGDVIVPQKYRKLHEEGLKRYLQTGEGTVLKKTIEVFALHRNGTEFPIELSIVLVEHGETKFFCAFIRDIAERKNATEMFINQFNNSPDTILYVNKDLKIESINRVLNEVKTKEEVIGSDCIEILPKESQDIARTFLMKCFETGENQEFENLLSHGRWVRSRFVPVKTNEEISHVMIFATDLTEKKQAELKLLQSEEKYRVLTENISDAILLINENFEIEYTSPSTEYITGYTSEETKSKPIFDFFLSEELENGKAFYKKVYESPEIPLQNQFRIINKNGEMIWLEGTSLNLLDNDSVNAIIINCRDVTARKKFEEQQALMSSIVNSSDDAIISKTIDGIITSWNKGAEKVLGYAAEETVGNHISMLIPFELRGEEIKILDEISKDHSVDHYETKRMKKNRDIVDVSLTISPIKNAAGVVVGASKIMRDITQTKQFEDELIRYNEELKKTNDELDRFVYSASHDLRAPLKSMLGLINITKEELEENENEPDKSEMTERLGMLHQSAEKLDNFIEDILDYSKNARMVSENEEINFKDLINEIQENLKYMKEGGKVNFNLQINSNEKFVSDYKRLSVILNNVISNAYKYCDVSKENSFINVTFTCDKQKAQIIIEDNGIGIAEKDKEKIFEMFHRSTILSTGSGIGLYIVKETLEKMKGKISVESELNKGTKFIIETPNKA